jgi:AcrR family transcriptional regulator
MTRRDELLLDCRRYFLAHGVANLSLRPLAAAVGTSARLIVYHFGSKEGLIAAVMDGVRAELQATFAAGAGAPAIPRSATPPTTHPMRAFWQALVRPENLPILRLLFEVQILALQNPVRYGRYLEDTSQSWVGLIEQALPESERKSGLATLCAAVVDGLLLEYLATGDLSRATAALDRFLDLLAGPKTTPPRRAARKPRSSSRPPARRDRGKR